MTAITISRQQAHDADACVDDTRMVLDHLRERDGRIPRKTAPISLVDVGQVLGVDGVVWCLSALGEERLLRRFACLCARRALRRADVRDAAPWRAVRVAWWGAHGWATAAELRSARAAAVVAARAAARDAAQDAGWAAAWGAAWDAAWGAAWAAARADARAARDAAWDAAVVGARADAWDATGAAAWSAERDWQLAILLTMAGYATPDGVADLTARSAA